MGLNDLLDVRGVRTEIDKTIILGQNGGKRRIRWMKGKENEKE
jgi:hypothetical protein